MDNWSVIYHYPDGTDARADFNDKRDAFRRFTRCYHLFEITDVTAVSLRHNGMIVGYVSRTPFDPVALI